MFIFTTVHLAALIQRVYIHLSLHTLAIPLSSLQGSYTQLSVSVTNVNLTQWAGLYYMTKQERHHNIIDDNATSGS